MSVSTSGFDIRIGKKSANRDERLLRPVVIADPSIAGLVWAI